MLQRGQQGRDGGLADGHRVRLVFQEGVDRRLGRAQQFIAKADDQVRLAGGEAVLALAGELQQRLPFGGPMLLT